MYVYSQFWPKGGFPGILHHYAETLTTFEFTSNAVRQPHSILFTGGLGDGLATTSFLADVVRATLPTEWSLFSLTLTSSYQSWGLGHLDRDTDEIAQCIRYIKEYKKAKFGGGGGKLVLMGHSTGSQCVLHYLSKPNPHTSTPRFDPWLEHVTRPDIDGAIMQAPVSDREAIQWVLAEGFMGKLPEELRIVYNKLVELASEAVGRHETFDIMLPISLTSQIGYPSNTALSARRFLSLISPESPENPSEDDLFSSDLSDERLAETFGKIKSQGLLKHRLMVLMSGADQSIPDWVDKENLLARFRKAVESGGDTETWDTERSGIIPHASHALSNDDQAKPRRLLVKRVLGYLDDLKDRP
ncbi:hypothetical protein OQA88_3497 [Cercophora sp. LCS_1]